VAEAKALSERSKIESEGVVKLTELSVEAECITTLAELEIENKQAD